MDHILNRRLLFATQTTACALLFVRQIASCALILLAVSGCSLFEQTNSLSSLLHANAQSSENARSEPSQSRVADSSTAVDQMDQIERAFAESFEQPSAPAGRLLSPDFDDAEIPTAGHSSLVNNTQPESDTRTESATTSPTTVRPVAQARDLFEDSAQQTSLESDPRSVRSMERTINAMALNQPQGRTVQGSQPIVEQVSAESTGTVVSPRSGRTAPQPEASGLDRLRGLLPDRKPGNLLKRQFEGISAPWEWNPFGGREENPAASNQTPEVTARVVPPAPQATPLIASNRSDDLLQALIAASEQELDTWPQTDNGTPLQPSEFLRRQLNVRLLRLIADEPAAAAEAIEMMTSEEQEFWQELILAISQFRNPNQNVEYGEHIAATIGQLRQAVQQLEPLSSLSISRLDFCSKIHKFGMIDTFPSNTFDPGERLIIYAEVNNLQAEVSPLLDTYRTSFSGTLEIWPDASENPSKWIERWPHASITDESTTRRSDFYQSYQITLPAALPQGDYEIRLQIRDDISGRTVESTLKFAVQ